MPIGLKLPLAAALLVVAVGSVMAYASYTSFERALLDTARERQKQVSTLFNSLFAAAANTALKAQLVAAASKEPLAAYVRAPDVTGHYATLNALEFPLQTGSRIRRWWRWS